MQETEVNGSARRARPRSRGDGRASSAGFAGVISDCSPRTHGTQPVAVLRLDLPDGSPRTAGPQPRDVLRLDSPDGSPRTAGPQPRDVLRLALRPGGRFGREAKPPSEHKDSAR